MLKIYFGEAEGEIYNPRLYFANQYEDEWITSDLSKEMIKDVDRSEVIDSNEIKSPVLGSISPLQLSGGVKALMLMKHYPGKIFNASNCGDNCAKWILKLAETQDFTINLFHVMDFGDDPFDFRILNKKGLVVHNMQEFLNAGVKYLQENRK